MSSGDAMWAPGFRWKTSCKVNLLFFPFDTQICEVVFTNWVYGAHQVNLTNLAPAVDISNYVTNGEWNLVSTAVGRQDLEFRDGSEVFVLPQIAFQLKLKRRPSYFILNLVLPTLIMTAMSLLVFCLPADAGEKASFCYI